MEMASGSGTVSTRSYHPSHCSFRVQILEVVSLLFRRRLDVDDGGPSSFKIDN